jgi:hypothetical protein
MTVLGLFIGPDIVICLALALLLHFTVCGRLVRQDPSLSNSAHELGYTLSLML